MPGARDVLVEMRVNGEVYRRTVPARTLLVHFLREELRLTGTHVGCDTTQCGACTVDMDGVAVKSCAVLAAQASGREITTIEGLGGQHPVQRAFHEAHGLQCGYCTPGMVMAVRQLLADAPDPAALSGEEIRAGLAGNLCRCTGYQNIVAAVKAVARGGPGQPPQAAEPARPQAAQPAGPAPPPQAAQPAGPSPRAGTARGGG